MRCSLGHTRPAERCGCGLYCNYTVARATETLARRRGADHLNGPLVVGVIAARGVLRAHHDGFRCPEAAILALATAPDSTAADGAAARAAGVRYGVPVVPFTALEHEAAMYGKPVSEKSRPLGWLDRTAALLALSAAVTAVSGSGAAMMFALWALSAGGLVHMHARRGVLPVAGALFALVCLATLVVAVRAARRLTELVFLRTMLRDSVSVGVSGRRSQIR